MLDHAGTTVVPGIIFVTGLVAGELNVGVLSVGLDFCVDSERKEYTVEWGGGVAYCSLCTGVQAIRCLA